MQLEIGQGLAPSVKVDATRLIVRDNFGQPLVVVLEYVRQTIAVYKAKPGDNSELNEMLSRLGSKPLNEVKEITI